MKNAVVVETKDLRQILAEHFHVPQENVISSKYSYTVILDDGGEQKGCCENGCCCIGDCQEIHS